MLDRMDGVTGGDLGALRAALTPRLCDRITHNAADRDQHTRDEGYITSQRPDLIVYPTSIEDVSFIAEQCSRFGIAMTAWGAGTSLEGNALPVRGGVSIDFSRMDKILSVSPEDGTATVQAGVRRSQLNGHLKDTGLYFPVDPGADATLGGMAATRASGTTAVKFGTMRTNIASLKVVMADGRVIRTARQAPKSAAGFDLTALMVGSEGTLGLICELTVKLQIQPESVLAAVATFDDLAAAVGAVVSARQLGLDMARIEFLDDRMMAAINRFSGENYKEAFTLFAEFHGTPRSNAEQAEIFRSIVSDANGQLAGESMQPETRSKLWRARHNALYAAKALVPGKRVMITDVCVPISRLAECVLETRRELDGSSLPSTIAGHVGDGNFHAFIVLDPENPAEIAEAESLHVAMARRAIGMEGSCTGEHGIGIGKRDLLVEEHGPAVEVMASIKAALDPRGLLNPSKIFRDPIGR